MATGLYSNLPDIIVIDPNIDLVSDGICDPIVRLDEVTNYHSPDEYVQLSRAVSYQDYLLKFKAKNIYL